MRKGIHPAYGPSRILCVCGNVIETRSTVKDYHVEICSKCHPFFTGKQKLVDTAGRVERFRRKYGKSAETAASGTEASKEASTEPSAEAPVEAPAAKG